LLAIICIFGALFFLRLRQNVQQKNVSEPVAEVSTTPGVQPQSLEVQLDNLKPNDEITSPLEITGKVSGTAFFEASFPVEAYDESGKLVGRTQAQAQGDWMTEQLVPFSAKLDFSVSGKSGIIVLKKDNPSGLPENEGIFVVPVRFR